MKINKALAHLFVSRTRQKLIKLFFNPPSQPLYVRQLVRLAEEEINSVRRELSNLTRSGILQVEARSNRLFYQPNPRHPLYLDLLVLARKLSGLVQRLQDNNRAKQIKLLLSSFDFLSGCEYSPDRIDLVIVGDFSLKEIESLVKDEEKRLDREINYMVMDKSEFHLRRQKRDSVLVDFFLNTPIVILGHPEI